MQFFDSVFIHENYTIKEERFKKRTQIDRFSTREINNSKASVFFCCLLVYVSIIVICVLAMSKFLVCVCVNK
jgi:hypothetical protein